METSPLLRWVQRLVAIAQNGLTFSAEEFDRMRYREVQQIAAEMAAHPDGDTETLSTLFAAADGYATPRLISRGAVFDERDQILMVREAMDGLWTLPGGWIDVGESPARSVEREVLEESGFKVRATKLAALFDKHRHPHPPAPHHSYLLFFVCELEGGESQPSYETTEVGWFSEEELPALSLGRVTKNQIQRMFEHHRSPHLPADFD